MKSLRRVSALSLLGTVATAALCAIAGFASQDRPTQVTPQQAAFFETKVRPLLVERCFECHSEKQQKGGLRLNSRVGVLKGGLSGAALVLGDPDKSRLMHVLGYNGPVKMPPAGKLRPAEIEALTEWVKMGAPWPNDRRPHPLSASRNRTDDRRPTTQPWSFQPLKPVRVPQIQNPKSKIQNPIDAFILARLEAKGLTPAPPADRRTLIRRATFDLIGLPPTPEEVEAFVKDTSPNAWEKVIDRLLASPRYGERWGRHWLDVARYADSNGLDENKAFAYAYHYRDYVIAAFNKDKPYDQFITEQLAGDLMPTDDENLRNERLTATGFLVLGAKVLAEQDKAKMVMDIVDEQIEVMSKAVLGLTVACARCHDHKFDPISTKDYYALAGIFKSTRTMRDLGFVSNWMERPLKTADFAEKQRAYQEQIKPLREALQSATEQANAALLASIRQDTSKYLLAGWEYTQQGGLPSLAEAPVEPGGPAHIVLEAEKFTRGKGIVADFEAYGKGIGVIHNVSAPDDIEWDVTVPAAGSYQVELRYAAEESRPVKLYLNNKVIRADTAGQVTGSWQPEGQRWEPQGVFEFAAGKNTLRIERAGAIPHFDKILVVAAPNVKPGVGPPPRTLEQIAKPSNLLPSVVERWAARLRGGEKDSLFAAWHRFAAIPAERFAAEAEKTAAELASDSTLPPLLTKRLSGFKPMRLEEVASLYAEVLQRADRPNDPAAAVIYKKVYGKNGLLTLPDKPETYYPEASARAVKTAQEALNKANQNEPEMPVVMAVEDAKVENVRVHVRGNTLDLGDEVPRRFVTVLAGDRQPPIGDKASGRLELAQWLTRPDHPLTARVLVNRIWQNHFGEGLVRTPDNFGFLGDKPSHPELLDWLAATFVAKDEGGRMKDEKTPHSSFILHPSSFACNWSLKKLHRLIMTSRTYQMSSTADAQTTAKAALADPDNRLLWHFSRRRLEAEPFRDAMLALSGTLDLTMGGSLLTTKNNDYVTNDQSGNAARYNQPRRSVYLPIIRNALFDMFQAFDFGDPSTVNAKRASTTVAPQALYVMNSPFALEMAKGFAAQLLAKDGLSDTERLSLAYRIAFARLPSSAEVSRGAAFLDRYAAKLAAKEPDEKKRHAMAWQSFCQILFASNEFIYVN